MTKYTTTQGVMEYQGHINNRRGWIHLSERLAVLSKGALTAASCCWGRGIWCRVAATCGASGSWACARTCPCQGCGGGRRAGRRARGCRRVAAGSSWGRRRWPARSPPRTESWPPSPRPPRCSCCQVRLEKKILIKIRFWQCSANWLKLRTFL